MNKQELAFYLAHKKLKPEQIEELLTNFLNSELAAKRPKIDLLGAGIVEPDQLQNFANDFFKDAPNNVDKSIFAHLDKQAHYDRVVADGGVIPSENIKPEDMVSGEWYAIDRCLFRFIEIVEDEIITKETLYFDTQNYYNRISTMCRNYELKSIRKATKEEVLKYFPNEQL